MFRTAEVVLWVLFTVLGIHGIRVEHVNVHRKIEVWVLNMLAPIWGRHDPALAVPGVGNLLIPAIVEDTATVVMVAEYTEPRHFAEGLPSVHPFKNLIELVQGCVRELAHRCAAVLFDAAPVEVISNIENIIWLHQARPRLESIGNQDLRLIVHAPDIPAPWDARRVPFLVEAFDELLVVTNLTVMMLVPPGPWENARASLLATIEHQKLFTVFDRVQGAIHAPPVTNGKDVHLLLARKGHGGPGHPLVTQSLGRRLALDAFASTLTTWP
mmetsp:Transcript_56903/g.92161  ORF Transcript_56903/g.92161 Transcript_56903/m.92161 type:complete len:270 (+) Transcript_56903:666-1475(+)